MALDRNCKETHYVVGRLIAIVEHYASSKFGPNSLSNMFTHPREGYEVFGRYIDADDEYIKEIEGTEIPVSILNEMDKSKVWVGYYHQKKEYGDTKHGGLRPNSGRPSNDRNVSVSVRVTREAADLLATVANKSEFIDTLIKQTLGGK